MSAQMFQDKLQYWKKLTTFWIYQHIIIVVQYSHKSSLMIIMCWFQTNTMKTVPPATSIESFIVRQYYNFVGTNSIFMSAAESLMSHFVIRKVSTLWTLSLASHQQEFSCVTVDALLLSQSLCVFLQSVSNNNFLWSWWLWHFKLHF